MKTNNTELFENKPVSKAVLALVIPTVISQLITVVYNMTDTFFIGQLGDSNQVAAATICMPVFLLLNAFSNLFGIGGASNISRCLGAGDREKAQHCAAFCIWTAIVTAFLYGLAAIFARSWLLPLLGADYETYGFCCQYAFWTVTIGAIPTVLNALLAHLVRSEGYSREAGFGVAFGGILNIVLDPIFIFPLHMDIAGAAIATMLSNLAATAYFFILLYIRRKNTVITPNPKYYSLKNGIPADVIVNGLPSAVMTLMSTLSNSVLNHLVASYSNKAIAGMGIAKKIDMLAFAIAQGMTQGVLPLIGYTFASGNRKRMGKAISTAFLYSMLVACVGTILLFAGSSLIVGCFIPDAETVSFGHLFLRIICLACPSTAISFMIITVFQATNKKVQPLILSMFRKGIIDVPFMFLFNNLMGVNGIAWATPMADWLALIISLAMFLPYVRRIKEALQEPKS